MLGLLLIPLGLHTSLATVTVASLLNEMTDLRRLAHAPNPRFTMSQASSYDRKSVRPGNDDWFANADWGQYIREEVNQGRKEHVMADLKGPGAVVRMWSANPNSIIRMYFDGETTPRIVEDMDAFLTGRVMPFDYPFGYEATRGHDLYFPFPYAKSLKITVDESNPNWNRIYYHVGFRTYGGGTSVETYDATKVPKAVMAGVGAELKGLAPLQPRTGFARFDFNLGGNDRQEWNVRNTQSAISSLTFRLTSPSAKPGGAWNEATQPQQIYRHLLIEMTFDGETTVRVPVADFFGAPPSPKAYTTFPVSIGKDGSMTCRWVMPYARSCSIRLVNQNKVRVSGSVDIGVTPFTEPNLYHFHAQWTPINGKTRPFSDMPYADLKGEGYYVGSVLAVQNTVNGWWGEGDEKVFVDGESFPSTIGTGTEDYFGYAWSNNIEYARPYHAQPRDEGIANRGQMANLRWHIVDAIPYQKDLRFYIEKWHWIDCVCHFQTTAFWYAAPGGTAPNAIKKGDLAPLETPLPKPIPGAIEGETLHVVGKSGGISEVQGGFEPCSGGAQLWWRDCKVGDTLQVAIPVPESGKYRVLANFCYAVDYGVHQLSFAGKTSKPMDFYSKDLKWKVVDLGEYNLDKGENTLTVTSTGANGKAEKRQMFAIDYFQLKKVSR